MFTWIPIHEEIAKKLLEYKDRSQELVSVLARMKEKGLTTTKITDQGADGSQFQLKEIDPFSFFANFNRGTTDDNRQSLWQVLKDEWQLKSAVPEDFDGVPLAAAMKSWLMPYANERSSEHVPLLWKFFEHIMSVVDPESLDVELMQQCLNLPDIALPILSMGMFWACPNKWISTDKKNLGFAETKGVSDEPKTATEYLKWLPKIRAIIGVDAVEFSQQAHLWATKAKDNGSYGSPFDKMFAPGQADRVLDIFKKALEIIADELPEPERILAVTFGSKSETVPSIRVNVGMWYTISYNQRPSRHISFILPKSHPEVAIQKSQRC